MDAECAHGGAGCNAGGVGALCRFCGFGPFAECPDSAAAPEALAQELTRSVQRSVQESTTPEHRAAGAGVPPLVQVSVSHKTTMALSVLGWVDPALYGLKEEADEEAREQPPAPDSPQALALLETAREMLCPWESGALCIARIRRLKWRRLPDEGAQDGAQDGAVEGVERRLSAELSDEAPNPAPDVDVTVEVESSASVNATVAALFHNETSFAAALTASLDGTALGGSSVHRVGRTTSTRP